MKAKFFLVSLVMLAASQAQSATVLTGDGISWSGNVSGIGTDTGTITLNADTSGAQFKDGTEAFLAGIELKPVGGDPKRTFTITSVSLDGWGFTNSLLNRAGTTCHESQASFGTRKRGCVFAETAADRISSAVGDLSIVLGVNLDPAALPDTFHLKVQWEDENGKKIGRFLHDEFTSSDLTAVPLPAAAWLFTSALIGLTVVARRNNGKMRNTIAIA